MRTGGIVDSRSLPLATGFIVGGTLAVMGGTYVFAVSAFRFWTQGRRMLQASRSGVKSVL